MAKKAASKVLSVEGREVQITHPDKLYFSSQARISKLDLVRYYLSVAPGALAGIQDRPIVLKRFVNGAEGGALGRKWLSTLANKAVVRSGTWTFSMNVPPGVVTSFTTSPAGVVASGHEKGRLPFGGTRAVHSASPM